MDPDDQLAEYRRQMMENMQRQGLLNKPQKTTPPTSVPTVPESSSYTSTKYVSGSSCPPPLPVRSHESKLIREKEKFNQQLDEIRQMKTAEAAAAGLQWKPLAPQPVAAAVKVECSHDMKVYDAIKKTASCRSCGKKLEYDVANGARIIREGDSHGPRGRGVHGITGSTLSKPTVSASAKYGNAPAAQQAPQKRAGSRNPVSAASSGISNSRPRQASVGAVGARRPSVGAVSGLRKPVVAQHSQFPGKGRAL